MLFRSRFTVLSDTPIASAIEGCVIPLSRSNTIWIRWRCSGCPFQRSAVFKRRIWPLVHLTICSSESDGQSESHSNARMQFTPLFGALIPQTFRFNQLWKRYQTRDLGCGASRGREPCDGSAAQIVKCEPNNARLCGRDAP